MKINEINKMAQHEGWGLFFCYGSLDGILQIQKVDDATTFKSDIEAITHVSNLAKANSYLHKQALNLADDSLINL